MLDKLLLLLVGLAFFLYGVEVPLLSLLGSETSGEVTAVAVQPAREARSVPYWTVTYRFQTRSGKSVTGSVERSRVDDSDTLPRTGSTLRLVYLEALPFINQPSGEAGPGLVHFGVMALGLVLVGSGLLGVRRPHGRRTG